jgi:hypothetical protein
MSVTDPWSGEVKTIYWAENMYNSEIYRGLFGTVCDIKKGDDWDWAIEIFLGSIWHYTQDFQTFTKEFFRTWLEEWLHMVYRWERVNSRSFCEKDDQFHFMDEEKPVRAWVKMLIDNSKEG